MYKYFSTLLLLLTAYAAQAQQTKLPRYFLDIPAIYATAPDVANVKNNIGLGAEAAFNVATHYATLRIGGGSTFTLDPKAEDVVESIQSTPYGLLELGAGLYRSNGNQCAKQHQNAFTAMAVVGMRYNIDTRSVKPAEEEAIYGLNFGVGAEFSYFYITDIFRNTELFLRGTYYPNPKTTAVNFGFKFFLNMRAIGE
ncbi:MAG: hypothetical protein IPL65_15655 [Lewinellaceae bacterium]|nr:hypothetical protein [Lewinellaceae bacterium]